MRLSLANACVLRANAFGKNSQTMFGAVIAKMRKRLYNSFMQRYEGFSPLFDGNSKILVLGSFPSIKSREQQFYYGNPQNRFWKTLRKAFGGTTETVADKKRLCLQNGIALWDIVASCEIDGSLDCSIKNFCLADLSLVLNNCKIEKILCNGAKAFQLTSSVYNGAIPLFKMPSTSPANTRFDESVWLNQLKTPN